jgi:putative zinc finger protein
MADQSPLGRGRYVMTRDVTHRAAAATNVRTPMTHHRLTCQDVAELATDYFEGSLPAATSAAFAAHVAGCPGCQAFLRQLRITVDVVHTAAEPPTVDTSALRSMFRAWSGARGVDSS